MQRHQSQKDRNSGPSRVNVEGNGKKPYEGKHGDEIVNAGSMAENEQIRLLPAARRRTFKLTAKVVWQKRMRMITAMPVQKTNSS